jgi:hypothetical protein
MSAKQKASEARYREAHKEERRVSEGSRRARSRDRINARRRQTYAARQRARRAYFKKYYQKHKKDWGKNACPDCDGLKLKTSRRCKDCSWAIRRAIRTPYKTANRRIPNPQPNCPYCFTEMRALKWRGTDFWRCGSCGLETTPLEVSRFVFEEELAA